ncbi:MAG: flagellar protein FlaG [Methylococcaceae bacterium]|nr:flagellar protein FlaG [Methylococcaceae bacterium]
MNNDISNVTRLSLTPFARDINNTQKNSSSINADEKVKKQEEDAEESEASTSKVTSLADAKKLADEGNKILESVQRNLQFKVDESTQQVVMSIIDRESGETIRQIPSEEVLELAQRMQETDGKSGSIESYRA